MSRSFLFRAGIPILLLLTVSFSGAGTTEPDRVTLLRDEWGVPHVYGPTDASVVFGAAWAQAEDNWPQIEENFLRSLGRGAELFGRDALLDDFLARGLEIPRRSIAEYRSAPAEMRALYDAWAAGVNHYLATHPDEPRRLLDRVEPWYPLALIRFKYHHNEYLGYAGLSPGHSTRLMEEVSFGAAEGESQDFTGLRSAARPSIARSPTGERSFGSNQWAVDGTRTSSGYPMLLINPHVSFFGLSTYTEIHLDSEEGLQFSGLTRFGFVLPYMGNNEALGWAYTDNYGDHGDLYLETISRDGRTYRYGDEWRDLRIWTDSIGVLEDGIRNVHSFTYSATHHGPILGLTRDGRPLAVRLAKLDEGGWFEQWAGMMRARTLEDWTAAAGQLNVPYMNTLYADRDGNILYVYNHAIPRRSEKFDWRRPVDGSDPATEWNGYHRFDELPKFLNPASGYLQNTNSDPFLATDGIETSRDDFPSYMVGDETDNFRSRRSRQVLRDLDDLTLEAFSEAVLDTRMIAADEWLDGLLESVAALERSDPDRFARLEEAAGVLAAWDRRASRTSSATTLFVLWAERARPTNSMDDEARVQALEEVISDLEAAWSTWNVPWGDINRIQRPDAAGRKAFSDSASSLPVDGAPGWLGSVFTFTSRPDDGTRRRYGLHGNSFVKVVEFAPGVPSRSVFVFGQSGDPESPHYFDQARLYSENRFKRAPLPREDVEAAAVREMTLIYPPGD